MFVTRIPRWRTTAAPGRTRRELNRSSSRTDDRDWYCTARAVAAESVLCCPARFDRDAFGIAADHRRVLPDGDLLIDDTRRVQGDRLVLDVDVDFLAVLEGVGDRPEVRGELLAAGLVVG